nr:type II toxin-antitoxin system RelE/ParE family toxin [Xanthomonas nasturtii]
MTRHRSVATRHQVKLAAHFESNLAAIEAFLREIYALQAFDALVDTLMDTVIPNLERFPDMGRLLLERPIHSVEVANGVARLRKQLDFIVKDAELREYVMADYLMLYVQITGTVYLLSICHQRQLSFDLASHWPD